MKFYTVLMSRNGTSLLPKTFVDELLISTPEEFELKDISDFISGLLVLFVYYKHKAR